MKLLTQSQAQNIGMVAIFMVLATQAFNSFACYQHGLGEFLTATAYFVLPPLVPAAVALFTANPLRAAFACALVLPWLALAYYVDCVVPYSGGGASMVYVVVLFGGVCSSLFGAVFGGWLLRLFGVTTIPR